MARMYADLFCEDRKALDALHGKLISARKDLGVSAHELAGREHGRHPGWIKNLESGKADSPRISSYQSWASVLGLRLEIQVKDFWLYPWVNQEMIAWYAMSRPWGADEMMRQWLVAALACWRARVGVDVYEIALKLKCSPEAVLDWESESVDPLVKRAMLQARFTGTRLRFHLWRKEDWRFG